MNDLLAKKVLFTFLILIINITSIYATRLTVRVLEAGTLASLDNNILSKSASSPLEIRTTTYAHMYFIPLIAREEGSEITLQFRFEGIPPEEHNFDPNSDRIFSSCGGWATNTGSGVDYIEFTTTCKPMQGTVEIYSHGVVGINERIRFQMMYLDPFSINEIPTPEGQENVPNDHWFKLTRKKFIEAGHVEEYGSVYEYEDMIYEMIEVSGDNLLYDPTEVTTDSNGIFGVMAFVDPDSFDETLLRRTTRAAAVTPSGRLNFRYTNYNKSSKIKGYYCEVIMLEGKATVVGGKGNVKLHDILYPGTQLSLWSNWGEKSQIGLRFVNGSKMQLIQDVYTNSCITDLITIGKNNFGNDSVIQGKTALMSASRYLCEEIAGLPNTPEEWAVFSGKMVVKTAASFAVPGSGKAAFAIRYGVKTATGKAYDYYMSSHGDNRNRSIPRSAPTSGDERLDISIYHNGSTRITENISDAISIYNGANTSPFKSTVGGEWIELLGDSIATRTFYQTPDSIDKEGPQLRFAYKYIPELWSHTFTLRAYDLSGLYLDSLSVMEGATDLTSSFIKQEDGIWSAEFITATMSDLTLTLYDNVNNESIMNWSHAVMPGQPTSLSATPAYFDGGSTKVRWAKPSNIVEEDILFYEVKQYWKTYLFQNWESTSWVSVGPTASASLKLPEIEMPEIDAIDRYIVEVRACNKNGIIGDSARTIELKPRMFLWSPTAINYLLLN